MAVSGGRGHRGVARSSRHDVNPLEAGDLPPAYACSPIYKAFIIIVSVFTTLGGAAVVGFGVTSKSTPEYQPVIILEHSPYLNTLTDAVTGLGAAILILSVVGCVGVITESASFPVWYTVLTGASVVAEIIVPTMVFFVRTQVQDWIHKQDKAECKDCKEKFELAFSMLTPGCSILLSMIVVQVTLLYFVYKKKKTEKRETSGQFLSQNRTYGTHAHMAASQKSREFGTPKLPIPSIEIRIVPPTPDLDESVFEKLSIPTPRIVHVEKQ